MAMRAFQRVEPSHCRECGAPINEIHREIGFPARLGCYHDAQGYVIVLHNGAKIALVDRAEIVNAVDVPTAQLDIIERTADLPDGPAAIAGTYDRPDEDVGPPRLPAGMADHPMNEPITRVEYGIHLIDGAGPPASHYHQDLGI